MRVLFASTRGAGHFNPLVPFIEGALRDRNEVMVAGPPSLAETVEGAGYRFWPGEAPPEEELATACHGGSGTTLGARAAGLPLVVVPLFADQPVNARRVAAVGAGLAVEPEPESAGESVRSRIDPAALHAAIETVLGETWHRDAARQLAGEMNALPPADAALTAIGGT